MAFDAPTYSELSKIIEEYMTDHGYKENFLPEGSPDMADSVRMSLDEEDIPGLVSHLSLIIQQKSNGNIYFFDSDLNREFATFKMMLSKLHPVAARLFMKTIKLQLGLIVSGRKADVSV